MEKIVKPGTVTRGAKAIINDKAANQHTVHISDAGFARALHDKYPDCIDENNNLLPPAGQINELILQNAGIKDLSGIQGFLKLRKLDILHNSITNLPELPNTLGELYCNENNISFIKNLPTNLKRLDCRGNKLRMLPKLPPGMVMLLCGRNQLNALSALPRNLDTLMCNNNNLNSLPVLPETLVQLDFSDNNFSVCPKLPGTLLYLGMYHNKIVHLPNLPKQLGDLRCDVDRIDNVPLSSSSIKISDETEHYRNKYPVKQETPITYNNPPVVKYESKIEKPVVPQKVKSIYFIYRAYIYYYDAQREYHPAKYQVLTYVFDMDPNWNFDQVKEKLNKRIVRGLDDPQGTRDNEFIYPCNGNCNQIYEERSNEVRHEHANALIDPIRYITIE